MNTDVDELLDCDRAGRLMGLKPETVLKMAREGQLPCTRPTGRRLVRFSRRALEELLRLRSQPMKERA